MKRQRIICWFIGHKWRPAYDVVQRFNQPAQVAFGRYCARCGR